MRVSRRVRMYMRVCPVYLCASVKEITSKREINMLRKNEKKKKNGVVVRE